MERHRLQLRVCAPPDAQDAGRAVEFRALLDTLAARLAEVGAGLADVVTITSFHTGPPGDVARFGRMLTQWGNDRGDASWHWIGVGVTKLSRTDGTVEVEAVCELPAGSPDTTATG